jgi:hypothetical protein
MNPYLNSSSPLLFSRDIDRSSNVSDSLNVPPQPKPEKAPHFYDPPHQSDQSPIPSSRFTFRIQIESSPLDPATGSALHK